MKTTVKIGNLFARVYVGTDDKEVKAAVAKHVEACPQCQAQVLGRRYESRSKKVH